MSKDFDGWNGRKKKLNEIEPHFYREGEVWWCSVGVNVGVEEDGTGSDYARPVVVLRSFNRNSLIAIALTGHRKDGDYYIYLGKIDGRDNSAILSQIRHIDSRRLLKRIGKLDEHLFAFLKSSARDRLFPHNSMPRHKSGRGRSHYDAPEFTFTEAGPEGP